jgi:hypothetical protein
MNAKTVYLAILMHEIVRGHVTSSVQSNGERVMCAVKTLRPESIGKGEQVCLHDCPIA